MFRVSTNMPNDDIQFRLRRKESELSAMQSKIAEQTRIHELRDDPLAASHAVRYHSYLARLNRFETNTLDAKEHYNLVDGYLRQANDIMQRVRELAVTGANGVYTKEDTSKMGIEVNELLKELVSIANATGKDGKQLFAGDKAFTLPFRIVEGTVEGLGASDIIRVEYRGAGAARKTEISDNAFATLDVAGSDVFWAEKMQVFSNYDASAYRAPGAASFFVDGTQIFVNAGDSAAAIAAKINDSGAPVRAHIDPETNGIALQGTDAHLIRMEDGVGGTTLRDLGLVTGAGEAGLTAWNPNATVTGGSIFDVVVGLRDAFLRGDHNYAGGQGLGGIDEGMANLQARLTGIGARTERVDAAWRRLNEEIPNVTASLDREAGIDLASAAMELGMMDMAHKAALQTAARILPPTLLDFLR
ncbi:MAG: flagellar hook-associated protein 3 [Spirochaetaceae bacterium]|jgi:flagellar hook-associated protein 3 FlgL|nr:flagellar hook-associated protein 3 [Spirochaetaceae bacterium]